MLLQTLYSVITHRDATIYRQKPYLHNINTVMFGIIMAKRGSSYIAQSTSYEVQNIGSLGDLGAQPQEISLDRTKIFSKKLASQAVMP